MMPAAMNKRGLEGRVVHGVEDGRHHGQRAVEAQQQRDQAEMADGGIRQQALQVMLEDGDVSPYKQSNHAGGCQDPEPGIRARHDRPEPRHQEDARLHQRRRMQVGGNRRGRRHGVRQPEMERELRALGQGTEQDQDQRRQVERVVADHVARRQHRSRS
jgi:hypothetical protein